MPGDLQSLRMCLRTAISTSTVVSTCVTSTLASPANEMTFEPISFSSICYANIVGITSGNDCVYH
jgi:hypothetical protein